MLFVYSCERTFEGLISVRGIYLFVMADGKVDFFNDTGGYGFIETDDSDEDVFFHNQLSFLFSRW